MKNANEKLKNIISQGSLKPKIRFLGQKVCSVAYRQTGTQTHTKVNIEVTLSGFQDFFFQPIIKDRSNKNMQNGCYLLFFFVRSTIGP